MDNIRQYVNCLNDPFQTFEELVLSFSREHNACFLLCTAGTRASDRDGISAAGVDAASRRLTPALDAEALLLGKTLSAKHPPVSPLGVVSPVVITRACLAMLQVPARVLDCGSFHRSLAQAEVFSERPAECPSSGQAMPLDLAQSLFSRGRALGQELSSSNSHLIVAECVPGGTTTAMAVLSALGHEVRNLLSSSMPSSNHEARYRLVEVGLKNAVYLRAEMLENGLMAVSAVGDPMQAFVSGLIYSASQKIPVYLAGGSQMLAVWALAKSLLPQEASVRFRQNTIVLSTKWVAFDRSAGVRRLAEMLEAPFAVACPDFYGSSKAGLRAYEEGHVKEGVGAGASLCLARAAGFSADSIISAVDACYDELIPEPARTCNPANLGI